MTINRTTYPHTGIYQRKIRKAELRPGKEIFRDLTELLADGHQDDPLGLNAMESEATEFLKTYIETEMPGLNEILRPESIEWVVQEYVDQVREILAAELQNHLSQEQRRKRIRKLGELERAADACEILSLIPGIRLRLLTQPSDQQAIGDGLLLGSAHERFRARRYERSVLTGSKTLAGARAGGQAAKESAVRRHWKIASDYSRSRLSQRQFEKTFGLSRKTLRRALKTVGPNPAK